MRQGPVVVGVDGSETGAVALDLAVKSASLHHAPLTIVTAYIDSGDVIGASGVGLPEQFWMEQEDRATEIGRAALATARERLGDAAEITAEVTMQQPIPYLLEKSETASLLVVGTRGLGRFGSALLGSVSAAIVSHAKCPVLVARDEVGELDGPVVVGVDGSEVSQAAIAVAAEEADLRGVPLQAVHSWTDVDLVAAGGRDYQTTGGDWSATEEDEAAVLSESLAGIQSAHPDLVVERTVVRDRPVRALLEASEKAQLVVVGSRGRGGFSGMLLGSTSRSLLASVSIPLLIVRPS